MQKKIKIPEPTVLRLPKYYRCLLDLKEREIAIISSEEISKKTGIKASQFRKDLSYFGEFGVQGIGYPVKQLINKISHIMQINQNYEVILIGAGNLGSALINYQGFNQWGFYITEVYDNNPQKIGKNIGNLTIMDIKNFPEAANAKFGIIAVPPNNAQTALSILINAGIKGILNFSGAKIQTSDDIIIRNIDLTHELAILSYYYAQMISSS
ncbi:MAG: redox-sensing transcriptional repressor Rex [Armatimonadetes bacterium]|nr:redox-sensing transcriptional repressor Rex [Armatimonadota bacterium]